MCCSASCANVSANSPGTPGRKKSPAAIQKRLDNCEPNCDQQLEDERFLQFAFFEQWCCSASYCAERGIRVIGDVSIFVSYDSADVWTHPELFRLKAGSFTGGRRRRASRRFQRDRTTLGQSAIRLGGTSNPAATTGGSGACAGRSRPATSFASIISAASKLTGRFPPTNRPPFTAVGSRTQCKLSSRH